MPNKKFVITLKKPVKYNITLRNFKRGAINPNHVAIQKSTKNKKFG